MRSGCAEVERQTADVQIRRSGARAVKHGPSRTLARLVHSHACRQTVGTGDGDGGITTA